MKFRKDLEHLETQLAIVSICFYRYELSIIRHLRRVRLGALTLILTRAGLAMDLSALLRLRFVVLRLAALPCLCEAAIAALLATWLLDPGKGFMILETDALGIFGM